MYNLYDDDDVEDVEGLKEKLEDNDKTKGKMKLLRSKMENMIITRKVRARQNNKKFASVRFPSLTSKKSSLTSRKSLPSAAQVGFASILLASSAIMILIWDYRSMYMTILIVTVQILQFFMPLSTIKAQNWVLANL